MPSPLKSQPFLEGPDTDNDSAKYYTETATFFQIMFSYLSLSLTAVTPTDNQQPLEENRDIHL